MKKPMIMAVLAAALVLSSCSSGVKQEDYDSMKSSLEAQVAEENQAKESVQTQLSEAESSADSAIASLSAEYEQISVEYASYKESMSAYEGLSAAEAEARRIEAESVSQAEADSIAAAESESIAQAEAEAAAGYETGITYSQLARTPDDYEGKLIKFKGKVVQVINGTSEIQIRLAVNNDYDNILYCSYNPDIVSSRVLEDDKITVYGKSVGLISYKSTMGGTITIPAAVLDKIDQ